MSEQREPARGRRLVALLAASAALVAGNALHALLTDAVPLGIVLGAWLRPLMFLLVLALLLCVLAAFEELQDWRGQRSARGLAPLRWLAVIAVLTWLAFLFGVPHFQRLWLELGAGLAAGLCGASVLADRRLAHPRPVLVRVLELVLVSLALAAPLGELGLRMLSRVSSAPLLARLNDAPAQQLERFRCKPGELRFGFPCNARGYYDDPLAPPAPGERLVVAIGDSFHLGAVPHELHLTTVAERELGIPVHNLGVAGVGPLEYLRMLVEDALPLEPDLVVVSVFVGNDLAPEASVEDRPDAWLRTWFERDAVLLAIVPARLARLRAERAELGTVAVVQGLSASEDFPWTGNTRLEQPTLTESAFLALETARAQDVCAADPPALATLCEVLLEMRRLAGDAPLVVQLIPDEFQVEPELWDRVTERAGGALERDQPQRLLASWLDAKGIAYLDLLPVLRDVTPMQDGKRHLYHLRDTHFNARGNRVAGEALAAFVRELIPE